MLCILIYITNLMVFRFFINRRKLSKNVQRYGKIRIYANLCGTFFYLSALFIYAVYSYYNFFSISCNLMSSNMIYS